MYNVNFNISGDLHIHLGNDILDSIFPDELAEDEAENGEVISIDYRPEAVQHKAIPLQAAVDYAKTLQNETFPDLTIGL